MITSIKVKFRPSAADGKAGSLYFQITHRRVVRQLNTNYRVFADEWDDKSESLVTNGNCPNRLLVVQERLAWDVARLKKAIRTLETERHRYTADDVISMFHKLTKESSFFAFIRSIIAQLQELGRVRTSETYTAALRSFKAFRREQDIPVDEISSDLMLLYEAHLKSRGISMNTISFYMRNLRAAYNRAVEKGLTPQNRPFRHVYTGVDKTVKRAIPIKAIKTLKGLDLTMKPSLDFARDMFMFSLLPCGKTFVANINKEQHFSRGVIPFHYLYTCKSIIITMSKVVLAPQMRSVK